MTEKSKEGRWGSLLQRGGRIVDRLTDTVKESVQEVGRGGLFKQALDARERGNLPAAFWLLDEVFQQQPDDSEVCMMFWEMAVDFDHQELAVPALVKLIEMHVTQGHVDLASQYWVEYVAFDPDALASPACLARILPTLAQREQEAKDEEKAASAGALLRAIRAIVDDKNKGLSAGVALRVAELARELDPDSALKAARFCLDAEGLHEVKRARLVALVLELDPDADLEMPELEPEPAPLVIPPVSPPAKSSKPAAKESPARNHPQWTESPAYDPLAPEEIEAAQLPPPRPIPSDKEVERMVESLLMADATETIPLAEMDAEPEPEPELQGSDTSEKFGAAEPVLVGADHTEQVLIAEPVVQESDPCEEILVAELAMEGTDTSEDLLVAELLEDEPRKPHD